MSLESLVKMALQQFGPSSAGMVGGLLQTLLGQFMNQGAGGFSGFLDLFRQAGLGNVVNGWLGGASTGALTEDQVKSALGGGLLNKLGSAPGVSASSLLPMLGFLIPKLVGVLTPGGNMPSASGLMQQMETLKNMPTLGGLSGVATKGMTEAAESGRKWLVPLIAGLALIGAILFFTRGGDVSAPVEKAAAKVDEAKTAVADTAKEAVGGLGAFFSHKLPTGLELNIPQMGIENKLIGFIEDAAKPVDKTTWFDFDRLLFDTGKATLQASSQEQLKNIAAILAAYPKVNIKLGGYTDNVGAKEANLKLSAARASNVMAELVKLGVDAKRMESEGYGDEHPVGDNTTETGRAQNRRISLRVTAK